MLKNDEYNEAPEIGQSSPEGVGGLKLKANLGNKELEGMKPCPHCDRMINEEDRVCMHCGFDLKKGKTVGELNKKFPVSPKAIVVVIVVVALIIGVYVYRQQVSQFIDDKAGTNLTEYVEKHAPVSGKEEETTKATEDGKASVAQSGDEATNETLDALADDTSVKEVVKANPFSFVDLEELNDMKDELSAEVSDLKEELKYGALDRKEMSKDLARAKKAYQSSLSKARKYRAGYQDKRRSKSKRLEYKEQYISFMEEAKSYKEEYLGLSKELKSLVAQSKEPKANLAKKSLELQQVIDAIKGKNN